MASLMPPWGRSSFSWDAERGKRGGDADGSRETRPAGLIRCKGCLEASQANRTDHAPSEKRRSFPRPLGASGSRRCCPSRATILRKASLQNGSLKRSTGGLLIQR
jgi:hypothetical protein